LKLDGIIREEDKVVRGLMEFIKLERAPSFSYYPALNWIIAIADGCCLKIDRILRGTMVNNYVWEYSS